MQDQEFKMQTEITRQGTPGVVDGSDGERAKSDERRRLAALRATGLLDTERELEFDQVIELAAGICGVPISLFSLVDETRQWFKAAVGISASETSRDVSFCSHAIKQPELFVVEDAHLDERFANNPLVTGDPSIRFYAGMPLPGPEGYMLGTLCVADVVPRQLTASQRTALQILATQLRSRVELQVQRRQLQEALRAKEDLLLALQSSEVRFRTFMDKGPLLSYIKDTESRFVFYNQRLADQFKITTDAWLGKSITEIWPGELAESYRKNDLAALQGDETVVCEEETVDEVGGAMFWRSYRFRFLNEKGEPLLGGCSVDITDEVARRRLLENTNARLERFATVDVLTGLTNRRVLDERLEHEFQFAKQHRKPFSIVLLDIDNFKQRNDTFGHLSGDDVLRRLGGLIQIAVRSTDIAGRYGGEEILLLLPDTDAEGASMLAQRLQRAMHEAKWPDGRVTASFGVATLDGTTRNSKRMVIRADDAMYEAKRLGKDRIVSHSEMIASKMAELNNVNAA